MRTHFKISRGLDVPVPGVPVQSISPGQALSTVAVLGTDFPGTLLRPLVETGQTVGLGDPLMVDKHNPAVRFVAPASGTVSKLHRGYRRSLLAIEITMDAEAPPGQPLRVPTSLGRDAARDLLLRSGAWTGLRVRPFGRVPDPAGEPAAIFVTAMDTRPLAPDPGVIIAARADDFARGLDVVSRLAEAPVFLCTGPEWDAAAVSVPRITHVVFEGPHPAGLPGTHIHLLHPVGSEGEVWHVDYQDVIGFGHLARTGTVLTERILSLAGPCVARPRLVRTRAGANLLELCRQELTGERAELVISGSVLDGAVAREPVHFLGHYHRQVSVIEDVTAEARPGWHGAGTAILPGRWPSRAGRSATGQYGRPGALMPSEAFERVMPLDILPVPLLKALLVEDIDSALALGCLELSEDDLALCAFVCPARQDYAAALRHNLKIIAEEG